MVGACLASTDLPGTSGGVGGATAGQGGQATTTTSSSGSGGDGGDAGGGGGGGGDRPGLGSALSLTGTCATASLAPAPELELSTADFTVEFWVMTRKTATQFPVWKGGNHSGEPGWEFELRMNMVTFETSNGVSNAVIESVDMIDVLREYHVVGTRSGTTGELWLLDRTAGNGVHTRTQVGATMPAWPSSGLFTIGAGSDQSECDLFQSDIIIDDVRVWDHVRSKDDFDADYDRAVDCSASGLVGYWAMDEAQGRDVVDCANGNDLRISAGVEGVDFYWVDSPFDD